MFIFDERTKIVVKLTDLPQVKVFTFAPGNEAVDAVNQIMNDKVLCEAGTNIIIRNI